MTDGPFEFGPVVRGHNYDREIIATFQGRDVMHFNADAYPGGEDAIREMEVVFNEVYRWQRELDPAPPPVPGPDDADPYWMLGSDGQPLPWEQVEALNGRR